MNLIIERLEKLRIRGTKLIARCPACAERGADRSCEHLVIAEEGNGAFGCIMHPGPTGHQHRRRIAQLVGRPTPPRQPILATLRRKSQAERVKPRLPALRPLNVTEMAAITHVRGWISFAGIEILTQRGLVHHGLTYDDGAEHPAWIITDSRRLNAQARRIDGKPWSGIGNAKAKTILGSDPSWPIGASDIGERRFVLLCEGGPDFLASMFVAWFENAAWESIAPCCMAGAANGIHPEALPLFAGKHVRIAVHDDDKGREAGERWARQLHAAGACSVDGFDFSGIRLLSGSRCKDLADFATRINFEAPIAEKVFAGLGETRGMTSFPIPVPQISPPRGPSWRIAHNPTNRS